MKPLSLQATQQAHYTCVANGFIDNYMPVANGEFVKIYLYVLRYFSGGFSSAECHTRNECGAHSADNDCFCLSFLADKFNMTENDVLRALKYWEKCGLMALSYQTGEACSTQALTGIILNLDGVAAPSNTDASSGNIVAPDTGVSSGNIVAPDTGVSSGGVAAPNEIAENVLPAYDNGIQKPPTKQNYTKTQIKQFIVDEELSQLLYIAQKYCGKTLTSSETNSILFFYEELKMSSDLIEHLLEYCISNGHKSFQYMEKVAIDWYENSITTPKQAAEHVALRGNDAFAVLRAFGITGRNMAPVERDYLNKWQDTYNFSSDIIIEACNRTMKAIHTPSFEYADKVLSGWKKNGIRTVADIEVLDKEHEKTKNENSALAESAQAPKKRSTNRFNNFHQRSYDYGEFEQATVPTKLV